MKPMRDAMSYAVCGACGGDGYWLPPLPPYSRDNRLEMVTVRCRKCGCIYALWYGYLPRLDAGFVERVYEQGIYAV